MPSTLAGALLRQIFDSADPFAAVEQGAHAAASSPHNHRSAPTQAQAEAGNYKLGDVAWHGLRLRIENPRHTVRSGVGPDGKAWSNTLMAHYGYIAGSRGADGDAVDVFLGPVPESTAVWVVNQAHADGSFDEHKCLAGFLDEQSALSAYRLSYERGWNRIRSVVCLTVEQLRWWLDYADTTRELNLNLVPPAGTESPLMDSTSTTPPLTRVRWSAEALPLHQTLPEVLYALRRNDAADGLLLDAVTMADITDGAEVAAMDALVVEAGRLQPKMQALQRVMEAAGGAVKPVAMQISDPLKRGGGVHVAVLFELSDGQTITVWLHNPDMTPARFTPADDLVSWKWMLNKRDVTIVVAPESGQDLNAREVARRLMKLAEKNSAAFQKANANRAAKLAEVDGLKTQLSQAQGRLSSLHEQIAAAKIAKEDREAGAGRAALAEKIVSDFVPTVAERMADNRDRVESDPGVVLQAFDNWWSSAGKGYASEAPLVQLMAASKAARALAPERVLAAMAEVDAKRTAQAEAEQAEARRQAEEAEAARVAQEEAQRQQKEAEAAAAREAQRGKDLESAQSYLKHLRHELSIAQTYKTGKTDWTEAEIARTEQRIRDLGGEPGHEFKTATDDARHLLAIGAQNPAPRSTYKTAVAIDREAVRLGLSVAWFSEESLPTLDDVGDGLFPELGANGYIGGTISRGTYSLATVHLRDDGAALFKPDMTQYVVAEAMGYAAVPGNVGDVAADVMGLWLDDPSEALQWLADTSEGIEGYEETERRNAEEAKARAEKEAQDAAARDAVLAAAQEFGATKPGFMGAVLNTSNGQSIKDALARKPVGSFVFAVDRDWNKKDDKGEPTWGVVMFTRQKLGKKGGLDPAGAKTGNLQATRMMATAQEAYAKGIENIRGAAGVVLEQPAQADPAPQPEPPAERPEVAFLREVVAGARDALALGDLLSQIEANVKALNEAGLLVGDTDGVASEAITHWVRLDEKANA